MKDESRKASAARDRAGTTGSTGVHRYRAYGIGIDSEVPLPELACRRSGGASLAIRRAALDLGDGTDAPVAFVFGAEAAGMWWREVGGFRIRADGGLIEVDPAPGVDDDLLAFPLLGPVLAMALHRRRLFLLHASAVCVDGAGIVLLGDKGAGKSTTATALLSAGHRLLSDDIAAFGAGHGVGRLLPAFPQVKLSDEALSRLALDGVVLRPPVHSAIDKHRVLIPGQFAAQEVPAARIYVIERGTGLAIVPCERAEALRHLLRFSYMSRFGGAAMDQAEARRHFMRAATLADSGIVHRLVLPEGIDKLPDAVDRIREDVVRAEIRTQASSDGETAEAGR